MGTKTEMLSFHIFIRRDLRQQEDESKASRERKTHKKQAGSRS
jgi:hypothetical protein